jgi:hypothetical protein
MQQENEATETRELTLGEKRCHITFNPSDNGDIATIKQKCAELINLCQGHSLKTEDPEAKRCFSLAMTEIETAQMYAVKGVAKGLNN